MLCWGFEDLETAGSKQIEEFLKKALFLVDLMSSVVEMKIKFCCICFLEK